MRSFFLFTTLVLLPAVLSAPTDLKAVQKYAGKVKPNSYIVTLKDGHSPANMVGMLKTSAKTTIFEHVLPNSFAAEIDEWDLNLLRADPNVESIHEDGIATGAGQVVQSRTTWGLQRISQDPPIGSANPAALQYNYKYDSSAGEGVDVYVLDTGINVQHAEFGGRAHLGPSFVGTSTSHDDNGHGTHCAGSVGGNTFGVAKRAMLVAVKVLDRTNTGPWSSIISGVDWAVGTSKQRGRPSILSMSLGGSGYEPMDQAVIRTVNSGIHVVVAAMNDHQDSRNVSPARVQGYPVITVAASDIRDTFATFSNYGPAVDIIAPGVDIMSAWIGSSTTVHMMSGTSMATPHVAGVIATTISQLGNVSPAVMLNHLVNTRGLKNRIGGGLNGTPNVLLRNEIPDSKFRLDAESQNVQQPLNRI